MQNFLCDLQLQADATDGLSTPTFESTRRVPEAPVQAPERGGNSQGATPGCRDQPGNFS
jgi:hypothetical protein